MPHPFAFGAKGWEDQNVTCITDFVPLRASPSRCAARSQTHLRRRRSALHGPDQWPWSSFRAYAFGETGPVRINDTSVLQMKIRAPAA